MNSMTGYGRGEATRGGAKFTVEVSSVNRRQGDLVISLPRELEMLETSIREAIHQRVARGRLAVKVTRQSAGTSGKPGVLLNVPLARRYAREFRHLARELKLPEAVSLALLARAPGVMAAGEAEVDPAEIWPVLEQALRKAIDALLKMRSREGVHLAGDLKARVRTMAAAVGRIRQQAPKAIERYRDQLRERIQAAGLAMPAVDDERLLKEIVLFADRADIAEELTRLESHFQQFADCVAAREPVGRTLDFLSQEMNREINTIGSKANCAEISKEVVTLKAELERFREQAQNVE